MAAAVLLLLLLTACVDVADFDRVLRLEDDLKVAPVDPLLQHVAEQQRCRPRTRPRAACLSDVGGTRTRLSVLFGRQPACRNAPQTAAGQGTEGWLWRTTGTESSACVPSLLQASVWTAPFLGLEMRPPCLVAQAERFIRLLPVLPCASDRLMKAPHLFMH